MRLIGMLVVAIVLLPFVKGAAQLLVLVVVVLTLILALKRPQETFGCIVLFALLGLMQRNPALGLAVFGLLIASAMLDRKQAEL